MDGKECDRIKKIEKVKKFILHCVYYNSSKLFCSKSFEALYYLHKGLSVSLPQAHTYVYIRKCVVEGEEDEDRIRVVVGHGLRNEGRDQVGDSEGQPVHGVGQHQLSSRNQLWGDGPVDVDESPSIYHHKDRHQYHRRQNLFVDHANDDA